MPDTESQEGPSVLVLLGDDIAAAQQVIRGIPADPALAVMLAMPLTDGGLPAVKAASAMPVAELDGITTPLTPGRLLVVPVERDVQVTRAAVTSGPNGGRGHVDRMLRSIADSAGRNATIVVLRGHGEDGALGLKRVREAGGLTVCQRVDEDDPMSELPRAVMATGHVDLVLGLDEIAGRVLRSYRDQLKDREGAAAAARADDTLRDILAMIRIRTGHDFTWYKRATLYRRLARRMQVCQTETIADYHRLLREHPNEFSHLLRDFLISVTNFFRDPEAFGSVAIHVMPRIFKDKGQNDQVRVWVAGCATGEEAYSLGILLAEHAGRLVDPPQLQVFATDIDEEALGEARAGYYPESIATDISQDRLDRFFTRENGGYRVNKELREMMLFSPHNVLRDPPFSRLDLVSCRNLLIYLNRDAQERVLNTFHFALRSEGMLFLGSSESAESMQQFAPADVKNRIFERRLGPSVMVSDTLIAAARWMPAHTVHPRAPSERTAIGSFGELHHRAVENYAPPSVLINEELDIVHLSEHASRFLTIAGGEPTRQILRLVHPALRFELRGAIYAARQPDHPKGDTRVIRFDDGGTPRAVEIRVRTVDVAESARGTMLVMFDELERAPESATHVDGEGPKIEPVVREMEDELLRTRDQLRTTIEQYETSLEELKASNEELHAINEELRSATEELETSKEELQSVNEELTTLNHELKIKVDELSRANSDLQNLMTSTDIGVLFLDRNLNIKRFTPRVQELFNVIPTDVGRPLTHLTHRLDYRDLNTAAAQVLVDLRTTDREVSSSDGKRFLLRFLPYRSLEDRIEGVVLTFVEVTDLKVAQEARRASEAALRTSEARLSLALAGAPLAVITHNNKLEPTWAFVQGNQLEVTAQAPELIFADNHAERYGKIVREVYGTGVAQRAELEVVTGSGSRTYDFRIEPTREGHLMTGVAAVGFDITPSKAAEQALRDSDRRKDEFLAILSHELRNPLTPLRVAFDVARLAKHDQAQLDASLTIMDRQLQVLVRLVDDLLDLSRISQGKIQLVQTRLDAVSIIEGALDAARPTIDEHRHSLTVKLPRDRAVIIGDFTRLTQVLVNLLCNAAKYTPEGGEIALVATTDASRRRLLITVRDNGMGIAPDMLARIFDIFVQARETEDRREGGIGIGLNLVRRIVELHGGSVAATSNGDVPGSTFTIELPLAPEEA